MSSPIYFVQGCPTCGRRLQIRVEYLGRKVVCQHCQGTLVAMDPANVREGYVDHGSALLRRADALLNCAAIRHPQSPR
ncbi:MAG: response regulator [Thermoguttaceae bacterium]|jgi:DNA-directed RNA polymerase subunit RPC12/RpoP